MDLKRRIDFLCECDALKGVERRTSPIGLARRENSAEHSWQAILSAIVLAGYAQDKIDLLKVLKMLAIHDIPEVDVLDTFHYDKAGKADLATKEAIAAERIFAILPDVQGKELLELWREFEARETPEAKFAASIDRLMAFLMNSRNGGGTWQEYGISESQMAEKNAHIEEGAPELWRLAHTLFSQTMFPAR